MKALLFMLLFIPLLSNGQIYKFRAYETVTTTEDIRLLKESDWKTCDVLVVFDGGKDKIQIYSSQSQEFDLAKRLEREENDKRVLGKYLAVDQDGKKSYFWIAIYKNVLNEDQSAGIIIEYSDVTIGYRLRAN